MGLKRRMIFLLATRLGWLLILLLGKLTRTKIIGGEHLEDLRRRGVSFIYLTWHGRILLPIYLHRKEGVTAMVSLHQDGEIIAQTLKRLGYKTIRGSSTRGGDRAFYQMIKALKKGEVCAIIPDGPKGPRCKFKAGALYLSQLTGAYLLPMSFSSSKKIRLNSWDRFTIICPLSKSVLLYGEPVKVGKNLKAEGLEEFRAELERRMIQLDKQADEYFSK